MRRLSMFLPAALILVLALPAAAYAANLPLLSPGWSIVPEVCRACPCGWGGILQILQNVMNAGVTFMALFSVLVLTYAGILWITAPASPENRNKAREMIVNAVLGIVIVLAAWLIVDFVMKTLYDPAGSTYGPWNSIIIDAGPGGGSACVQVSANVKPLFSGPTVGVASVPTANLTSGGTGLTGNVGGASAGKGDCSVAGLQSAWGSKAAAMSCVTTYENASCNPQAPSGTDIGSDGNVVSWGIYQINISADDLNYPACQAVNGGQPLSCTKAFAGGTYTASNHSTHVSNSVLYNKCVTAVSNVACNTQAAQTIFNKQGIKGWGTKAQNNCSSLLAGH